MDLHYRIIIREVPSRHVISYRKRIPDYSCEKELWNELYCFYKKENHIEISRQNDNNITIFHENKESDSGVDAEVCLWLRRTNGFRPFRYRIVDGAETMACMMVRGSYVNLDKAYQAFLGWLEEKLSISGMGQAGRYAIGIENEEKEEDYLTEIQIPVKLRNG